MNPKEPSRLFGNMEEMMWGNEILEKCSEGFLKVFCWNGIYIFLVLLISIIFTIPAILIPQNDVIKYPEYWWELIIQTFIGVIPSGINTYLECKTIFRYKFLASNGFLARLTGVLIITTVAWSAISIVGWIWILKYNLPIPFFGLVIYLVSTMIHLTHLWYEFPLELRAEESEKKRIHSYFWYRLWFIFYGYQNYGLKFILLGIPTSFQPVMAIIFPLAREMNLKILSKFLEKAINPDVTAGIVPKLTANIAVNIVHAFFVALIIASNATQTTSNCILAVDFLLNIYSTYRIFHLHRKTHPKDNVRSMEEMEYESQKKEEALDLFAVESVEYLVPLIYTVTFLIAYYGPNANIIGNVRMTRWKFQGVEDVKSYTEQILKMFAIDLASLIISMTFLFKFASVTMLREGYKVMKLFWPLIAVKIGSKIYQVEVK